MRAHSSSRSGLTLVEIAVTTGLVGVLGLIIYTLLNMGTVLGARNTATNTAHQQARVAMIEMIQDLHAAVSEPELKGVVGAHASGISFQQWGSVPLNGVVTNNGGPHQVKADAAAGTTSSPQKVIHIKVTGTQPLPIVGQRLIVPTHQIESDIDAVSGGRSDLTVTLHDNLPVAINGTGAGVGDVVCYITDRCSYDVVLVSAGPPAEYKLQWTKRSAPPSRDIVNDVTNPRPFSIPTTIAGAPYNRFVAAVDLSTSDPKYSKRGYKSANILLNGQVPYKARLTTYQ